MWQRLLDLLSRLRMLFSLICLGVPLPYAGRVGLLGDPKPDSVVYFVSLGREG